MKIRHITTIIAAALLLVTAAACSKEGEGPTGASYRVEGYVVDTYGLPIEGIGVSRFNTESGGTVVPDLRFRDTTDAEGRFSVLFDHYPPDLDTIAVDFLDINPDRSQRYAPDTVKVSFRGAVFTGGTGTYDGEAKIEDITVVLHRDNN